MTAEISDRRSAIPVLKTIIVRGELDGNVDDEILLEACILSVRRLPMEIASLEQVQVLQGEIRVDKNWATWTFSAYTRGSLEALGLASLESAGELVGIQITDISIIQEVG